MGCGPQKVRRLEMWSILPSYVLKFNVDGAIRGTPSLAGTGGVL